MSCAHINGCPLYGQFRVKGILQFWIKQFCEGDWAQCRRFQLSQQGQEVPPNLLPNGEQIALLK